MKKLIIGLSGKKGAGKNEIAKFITKYWSYGYTDKIYKRNNDNGVLECSFASSLKDFCINVLGLSYSQCYGSDEEKNTPTEYPWTSASLALQEKYGQLPGFMTGRDVMQIFGTDLIRETFGNVWAKATIRKINLANKPLSIITDVRFPNEIKAVLRQQHSHVIRLTRSPLGEDLHYSESALDDYDWAGDKCYLLDNASMTIDQQNHAITPILIKILNDYEKSCC